MPDEYRDAKNSSNVRTLKGETFPVSSVEKIPQARYRYLLLKIIANADGVSEEFNPPEAFNCSEGGVLLPAKSIPAATWATNIYEILDIGEGVKTAKDQLGQFVGIGLEVGQWVTSNSVSVFSFLGKQYATCSPEYITSTVKKANVNKDDLIKEFESK